MNLATLRSKGLLRLGAVKASKFVELEAINDITRTRIFTHTESGVNLIL